MLGLCGVVPTLTKVVAMLAEIFIMRLEALARMAQGAAPTSHSRFVPFYGAGLFEQKKHELPKLLRARRD